MVNREREQIVAILVSQIVEQIVAVFVPQIKEEAIVKSMQFAPQGFVPNAKGGRIVVMPVLQRQEERHERSVKQGLQSAPRSEIMASTCHCCR